MNNHLFIIHGDLTHLSADALAYSTSNTFSPGQLLPSFREHIPGFGKWIESLAKKSSPAKLGATFWLPLSPSVRPRGIVTVVATGGKTPGEDKARVAVRAAIDTAVERLRAAGHKERLLIALPTFRVGMAGDRYAAQASARAQIQASQEALQAHADVDVVFVTYTTALYQTFLAARQEVLGEPEPPKESPLTELEHALGVGECVLFVGAGLSRSAGLPDWSELIARLVKELRIEPSERLDFLDVAQWYREKFGTAALTDKVRQTYGNTDNATLPTLAHYLLLALPIRFIITTNYDDLLERALTALKRYPVRVVEQCDVAQTGQDNGVFVVKFHGDVAQAEDIVLCRDDYDAFFQNRPAMAALLEGLLLNQTFFFVGYGLRDSNFRQIFSRIDLILREARRPAFATTFDAAAGTADHMTRQWQAKRLALVPIPGKTVPEQEQQFLRFLDGLATRVMLRAPRLFLAPDTDVSAVLNRVRQIVVHHVGPEVTTAALHDDLSSLEIHQLGELLGFLSKNGWRPSAHMQLCHLWEALAGHMDAKAERRRLLVEALGYAERFDDVQRIRQRLEELQRAPDKDEP